jgi:hypothetical protein
MLTPSALGLTYALNFLRFSSFISHLSQETSEITFLTLSMSLAGFISRNCVSAARKEKRMISS